MKSESQRYRDYGFVIPKGVNRYLALPIFFAISYVFVLVFLPGIFLTEFVAFPSPSLSMESLLATMTILLGAVASETIFRGYIQTNLSNEYGFLTALITSSIMSTLCLLLTPFYTEVDSTMLFQNAIMLFAESAFLSVLFRRTKTLLCPVTYSASAAFLYVFTPIKAVTHQYAILFMTLPYVFFILVTELFMSEPDATEAQAIPEPSDPQLDKD
jgi:membrane protease YdiL (CAAX protease family)